MIQPQIAVFPAPQHCSMGRGRVVLPSPAEVTGPREDVHRAGVIVEWLVPGEPGQVHLIPDDELAEEEYRLIIDETVVIEFGAHGLAPALQTLRQLAGKYCTPDAITVPRLTIRDFPQHPWRGVMLDVARHFVPVPDLLRLIDVFAEHKFNRVQLHLSDHHGWRFECNTYPRLTTVGGWRHQTRFPNMLEGDGTPHGGFYTQEQLRRVVHYARTRGIVIVPEIDLPGHMAAALMAYPEFGNEGADPIESLDWLVPPVCVPAPTSQSLDFMKAVLSEVMETFDSPWIHIGGDEVPTDEWRTSEVASQLSRLGLSSPEDVGPWMSREMAKWVLQKGRTPILWDEAFESGPIEGAMCTAWRSAARVGEVVALGNPVIACPCDAYYLDYYQSESQQEPAAIGGLTTLEDVWHFDPFEGLDQGCRESVHGVQANLWTEYLPDRAAMEYMLWPRACVVAEQGWSGHVDHEVSDFVDRLTPHLRRLEDSGINVRPLKGPHAWQEGGAGRRSRPETEVLDWLRELEGASG